MTIHESQYPALLLNADFSPVSVFPLSTLSWQDAIKSAAREKIVRVAEYDIEVRSASASFRLPSVVALKEYRRVPRHGAFTRTNLWLRDEGKCVYCKVPLRTSEVTFDHVMPRSRGGDASWENIVCSCTQCNGRKANRTPAECGMVPDPPPRAPSQFELAAAARALVKSAPAPKDWIDYMYWDGELETG